MSASEAGKTITRRDLVKAVLSGQQPVEVPISTDHTTLPTPGSLTRRGLLQRLGQGFVGVAVAGILTPNSIVEVPWSRVKPYLRDYLEKAKIPVSTAEFIEQDTSSQHTSAQWENPEPITSFAATFDIPRILRDGTTNAYTITCIGLINNTIHPNPVYQGQVYTGTIQRGADQGYRVDALFRRDFKTDSEAYIYSDFGQEIDPIIPYIRQDSEGWKMFLINIASKLSLTTRYPLANIGINPYFASVFDRFEIGYRILNYPDGLMANFRNIVMNNNTRTDRAAGEVGVDSYFGRNRVTSSAKILEPGYQTQVNLYRTS